MVRRSMQPVSHTSARKPRSSGADGLLPRDAGDPLRRPVEGGDAPVQIDGEHPFGEAVEDALIMVPQIRCHRPPRPQLFEIRFKTGDRDAIARSPRSIVFPVRILVNPYKPVASWPRARGPSQYTGVGQGYRGFGKGTRKTGTDFATLLSDALPFTPRKARPCVPKKPHHPRNPAPGRRTASHPRLGGKVRARPYPCIEEGLHPSWILHPVMDP
jgi:hypothetical protein